MFLVLDEDSERVLLKKRKKLIETAESVEIAGDDEIRAKILSILYLKRKVTKRFNYDSNYDVLKSILILKNNLSKLTAGTGGAPLGGHQNPLFSLPFKPEGYDFELEFEFFITIWKILKKFCLILSVLNGIIQGPDNEKNSDDREYLLEIEELLRTKYKLKNFTLLYDFVLRELDDHIDMIFTQETLLAPDDVNHLPDRSKTGVHNIRNFIHERRTPYGMKIGQALANAITSICDKYKTKLAATTEENQDFSNRKEKIHKDNIQPSHLLL